MCLFTLLILPFSTPWSGNIQHRVACIVLIKLNDSWILKWFPCLLHTNDLSSCYGIYICIKYTFIVYNPKLNIKPLHANSTKAYIPKNIVFILVRYQVWLYIYKNGNLWKQNSCLHSCEETTYINSVTRKKNSILQNINITVCFHVPII